jgi:branched-chain amino acid transport system permease protein
MELAVATLVNALALSSIYIVVALGFVLIFSILNILNIAHGAIYMISGYLGWQLVMGFGLNQWLGLLLTVLIVGAFGIFLEKFCFRPQAGDFNRTLIVCVAIVMILQQTIVITVGYKVQSLPAFASGLLTAGPLSVSAERLVTFLISAALLAVIVWLINRTKLGQQIQAIAQNREGASLQGININRISGLTCAMGCGLAAVAGCLMGAYLNLGAFMGDYILVKALMIVILSGIGSIGGIFFAGLIIGTLDATLPVFLSGAISQAIAVGIIVIVMVFRPRGFFGREMEM